MKVRIVAAVVDTRRLILYKDDGHTIDIPQGHPLVETIVKAVLPLVTRGGVAEIELDFDNPYREFQEQSGGIVRLFKAAKNKLTGLFTSDEVTPGVFGEIPDSNLQLTSAIDEIIANAQPVTSDDYSASEIAGDQTMIAVVDNAQGERRVIPGVEKLAGQFGHSAKDRNTIGVQNLLKRMAGYIDKRQHSVEDLLRFLEKGDLPIADDGSIVAYKRLFRMQDKPGYFVDPYTRRVQQRVGSFVCVDESLVDKNRRNECSNGLHIGRRAYMGSFNGDAIVLCKIAPEDVIVVPHNDPNKVRVCGYHIIAELSQKAFDTVNKNKPMTEHTEIASLLAQVLAGNHIKRIEEVRITEQSGHGLKITPLVTGKRAKAAIKKGDKALKAPVAKVAVALDDPTMAKEVLPPSSVDPKAIAAEVTKTTIGPRQQRAKELFAIVATEGTFLHGLDKRIQAAKDLLAFKKKTKVSWETLGLSKAQVAQVLNVAEMELAPKEPTKPVKVKSLVGKDKHTLTKTMVAPSKSMSKSQELRQLHDSMLELQGYKDSKSLALAGVQARKLLDARRAAKKSWASLGLPDVTDDQLKTIVNAAPIDVPHVQDKVAEAVPAAKKAKGNYGKNGDQDYLGAVNESLADRAKLSAEEQALTSVQREALALVRGGITVSAASKRTGVHRRSIDRLIARYGK